jgi:hypothetical protein
MKARTKTMAKNVPVSSIIKTVLSVASDKNVQKAMFGVYADDTPRSFVDCINGEVLSPKQKKEYIYKKKKKKKNKNKAKIKL